MLKEVYLRLSDRSDNLFRPTFHALIAERVYKTSLPYDKAMEIILEGAGKAFDPVVVEAFSHIAKELYDERTILKK